MNFSFEHSWYQKPQAPSSLELMVLQTRNKFNADSVSKYPTISSKTSSLRSKRVVLLRFTSEDLPTHFLVFLTSWKFNHRTVILKCPLFLVPFPYEVNSTRFACKSVPLSKPKPTPIVFILLKEGPLWPTVVHAQGPQLFVSKPNWHASSVDVK